LTHTK
jgi:catabolite repression protein CreC